MKIGHKIHRFFLNNYHVLSFVCIPFLMLYGFLHRELVKNNRDLIYWNKLLKRSIEELDQYGFLLIACILSFKVLIVIFIILRNSRTMDYYNHLSQLEVKKRYADFLLLRLLSEIDAFEMEYLRTKNTKELPNMKAVMRAHDGITWSIQKFRRDARKLLWPNEMEIMLSIEDVYGLMAEEENFLKKSKFYHMNIHASNDLIKKLINPI
ncbi:uncharacterized protein LOC133332892 [Musca vetustissima]|uniref:uncharacterized protein LOC133332892 n=1 Tax=Musca vetustissima TaxID=27455 RepID=UPI002AB6D0E6|nr:uncharacterized protein LOC133332892 [Musca vetustissima]